MVCMDILVSNDDGVGSPGIDALARHAKALGNPIIIAPGSQRSAGGKSLTFHKPLRMNEAQTLSGLHAYSMNGNPADSILLYNHVYGKDPDLVLSGINSGENSSLHSILTSGTCAVSLEAGLRNVPSFALSIDVPENMFFKPGEETEYEVAARIGIKLVKTLLNLPNSYWNQVLFVNLNFPRQTTHDAPIKVVPPAKYKYVNYLIEREDPRGEKYYWLWGELRKDLKPNTDSFQVLQNQSIAVTPISFYSNPELLQITQEILSKGFEVA